MSVSSPRGKSAFWGFCFYALRVKHHVWKKNLILITNDSKEITSFKLQEVTSFSHCCVLNPFLPKFSCTETQFVWLLSSDQENRGKEGTRSCKLSSTQHINVQRESNEPYFEMISISYCVLVLVSGLAAFVLFQQTFSKHGWFLKGLQG